MGNVVVTEEGGGAVRAGRGRREPLVAALDNAVRDLDYDGVIGVLAHLRADELHLVAKYASSEVRAFLNQPNVFRDIYVYRVHNAKLETAADRDVTLQMRDLVEWAHAHGGGPPQPVNYWQIWLAAHAVHALHGGKGCAIDMGNGIEIIATPGLFVPENNDVQNPRGGVRLDLRWQGHPRAYNVQVVLDALADYTEIATRCTGFGDPRANAAAFAIPDHGHVYR